jgi:cardiolipin synthase
VEIFERRGVILHSRTAVIKGPWAMIGSTHLDWRSSLNNRELNAVVLGAEFGPQFQALFDKEWAASDTIALEAWQRFGLDLRIEPMFACPPEYGL